MKYFHILETVLGRRHFRNLEKVWVEFVLKFDFITFSHEKMLIMCMKDMKNGLWRLLLCKTYLPFRNVF